MPFSACIASICFSSTAEAILVSYIVSYIPTFVEHLPCTYTFTCTYEFILLNWCVHFAVCRTKHLLRAISGCPWQYSDKEVAWTWWKHRASYENALNVQHRILCTLFFALSAVFFLSNQSDKVDTWLRFQWSHAVFSDQAEFLRKLLQWEN